MTDYLGLSPVSREQRKETADAAGLFGIRKEDVEQVHRDLLPHAEQITPALAQIEREHQESLRRVEAAYGKGDQK